ncbi:MAG: AAA family ATPase [Polyangiaceae bacterium]|nr:AAA family ATPase [Polyangiaceae bacterium]
MTFDNSLEAFVAIVLKHLAGFGADDVVLRDVYGRLTLFLATVPDSAVRATLAAELSSLVPFVRPERLIVTRDEPGAAAVFDETHCQWLRVGPNGPDVRVVDRRVVGADWLAPPKVEAVDASKRFVFASMKGGVGRTTALCVAATELAAAGYNVLVVDLDLEAPGVGPMLWTTAPELGVVDYLAATAVGVEVALTKILAESRFGGDGHGGLIEVIPAYGASSLRKPENYLAKLARAVADVSVLEPRPMHSRVTALLQMACSARRYDVVLIDARAGLSELTAGPLLRLGASVLLFGTPQRQTFDDYRFLFAHLRSLGRPGDGTPWRNLTPVLAKAGKDIEQVERAQAAMYELFSEYIYEEDSGMLSAYNFDETDPDAPHQFVPVAFDGTFATFDPALNGSHLTRQFYQSTFAPLLEALWRLADLEPKKL